MIESFENVGNIYDDGDTKYVCIGKYKEHYVFLNCTSCVQVENREPAIIHLVSKDTLDKYDMLGTVEEMFLDTDNYYLSYSFDPEVKFYQTIAGSEGIDIKMVYPILMLNLKGFRTRYCCQGHFEKDVEDNNSLPYIAFDCNISDVKEFVDLTKNSKWILDCVVFGEDLRINELQEDWTDELLKLYDMVDKLPHYKNKAEEDLEVIHFRLPDGRALRILEYGDSAETAYNLAKEKLDLAIEHINEQSLSKEEDTLYFDTIVVPLSER